MCSPEYFSLDFEHQFASDERVELYGLKRNKGVQLFGGGAGGVPGAAGVMDREEG